MKSFKDLLLFSIFAVLAALPVLVLTAVKVVNHYANFNRDRFLKWEQEIGESDE